MNAMLLLAKAGYRTTDRELTAGLRRALDARYGQIARVARREWERSFGAGDPSDACVSVTVSGACAPRTLGR